MLQNEARINRVTVTEQANAGVFHTSDAPECEYQKWLEGLKQELSSMDAKGVLESVDPECRDNGIAPVASKLVLTKKPMEENKIELNESMGAAEVADITNKSWKDE